MPELEMPHLTSLAARVMQATEKVLHEEKREAFNAGASAVLDEVTKRLNTAMSENSGMLTPDQTFDIINGLKAEATQASMPDGLRSLLEAMKSITERNGIHIPGMPDGVEVTAMAAVVSPEEVTCGVSDCDWSMPTPEFESTEDLQQQIKPAFEAHCREVHVGEDMRVFDPTEPEESPKDNDGSTDGEPPREWFPGGGGYL